MGHNELSTTAAVSGRSNALNETIVDLSTPSSMAISQEPGPSRIWTRKNPPTTEQENALGGTPPSF